MKPFLALFLGFSCSCHAADLFWTSAQSPVLLTNDFEVPPGDTLVIEAGVVVQGVGGQRLIVPFQNSAVRIQGTTNSRCIFISAGIDAIYTSTLLFAECLTMTNGWIQAQSGLTTCILTNCTFFQSELNVRAQTNILVKNVFIQTRFSDFQRVLLKNNYFAGWTDYLINWPVNSTIQLNSFLDLQRNVIRAGPFDIAGNYWGTSDSNVISDRIFDRYDSFAVPGYVVFQPVLLAPDPDTPSGPPPPSPPPQPVVTIKASVQLEFITQALASYRVEGSNDFTNWVSLSGNILGNGGLARWYCPANQQHKFYRVVAEW